MRIEFTTDERNAEALLKWLSMMPAETFEGLPLDVENFLADLDVALVRR